MSDRYYFAGDPSQDSARRHLERVLNPPPRRRWPWFAALFASGTALTVWRIRQRRVNQAAVSDRDTASAPPAGIPPAEQRRPERLQR